jgi:Domain of unknown function DUF29
MTMGAVKEPVKSLYETDFLGWTQQQAEALRERRLDRLDVDNLIEEIESMGRQQQAELTNRLAVLLAHLLKWQHQPELRLLHGRSWNLMVVEQRKQIAILIRKNPSLKSYLGEAMADGYDIGRVQAARESGIAEDSFPAACPYAFEQVMTENWMPE